jgi:tRNA uridine 5-carboxymethylaminomethyl modification enzyme
LISDKIYKKFELYRKTVNNILEEETDNLPSDEELNPWSMDKIKEEVEIHNKYKGYIEIEKKMSQKMKKSEDRAIPQDFDYNELHSISAETKQRLSQIRPSTIGQASRIHSIKPSDIAILTIHLVKQKKEKQKKQRALQND